MLERAMRAIPDSLSLIADMFCLDVMRISE